MICLNMNKMYFWGFQMESVCCRSPSDVHPNNVTECHAAARMPNWNSARQLRRILKSRHALQPHWGKFGHIKGLKRPSRAEFGQGFEPRGHPACPGFHAMAGFSPKSTRHLPHLTVRKIHDVNSVLVHPQRYRKYQIDHGTSLIRCFLHVSAKTPYDFQGKMRPTECWVICNAPKCMPWNKDQ